MKKFEMQMITTDILCEKHDRYMVKLSHRSPAVCVDCQKENKKRDDADYEKQKTQMLLDSRLNAVQRPQRHLNCRFSNYIAEQNGQQIALTNAIEYAKKIIHGEKPNMIFIGRTGTGKTHLGCAISTYIVKNKVTSSVRYTTSSDLATEIMQSWGKSDDNEQNAIKRFTEFDLLIIDEIGLHDLADKSNKKIELIQKVLNARYDNLKPVLLISNLDEKMMESSLGDRNWSRLQQDGFKIVNFNWHDRRSQSIAGE